MHICIYNIVTHIHTYIVYIHIHICTHIYISSSIVFSLISVQLFSSVQSTEKSDF